MVILRNIPLSGYSTMRLGGNAAYLTEITDKSEIPQALSWAKERELPTIMIGIGSNIIWRDEGFPGLVLVNKIMGYQEYQEDPDNLYVTVGAGENWDESVAKIVAKGYSGIEELSLIPGTVGATPVQNVGAYGREIKDSLTTVEAFDTRTNQLVTVAAADCAFAYRSSRFNREDKGRFFITAITLHVTHNKPQPPFYASVQSYFDANNITDYSVQTVRDAVIAIRSAKLPDPSIVANCGSFFYNPIVSNEVQQKLLQEDSSLMFWPLDGGKVKLSAAWLVEKAGFKDVHDEQTGMATWPKQPLVLVNEHATNTAALLSFKQKIIDTVKSQFGIELQQEPQLLP